MTVEYTRIEPAPVDPGADQVMVKTRDVVRLATDVYLPPWPGPFPAVVAVHGGGFPTPGSRTGQIATDAATRVAALIDEPLPEPIFTDLKPWRHALPSEKADANELNTLTIPYGLAFCGDAFLGGRVHLALEHGIEVASRVLRDGRP